MWIELILRSDGIELVGQLTSRSSAEVAAIDCMTAQGVEIIEQRLAGVNRRLRDRRLRMSQTLSNSCTLVIQQMPERPRRRLEEVGIFSDASLLDLSEQELARLLKRQAESIKRSLRSQELMLSKRFYSRHCVQDACFGFCTRLCGSPSTPLTLRRKTKAPDEIASRVLESA